MNRSAESPEERAALGQALRAQRLRRDLTQEKLAERVGLHRTYIGGIERGERNPCYTNLIRIARALDIPLSELIERAEHADRASQLS